MTKGHKQLDRDGLFSPAFLAAVREALPTLEKLIDAYRDQHRNESDRTRFSVPTNRSVVPGPASQVFLCVITGHQRRVEKVAMTREQKDRLAHDDLDFLYDDTTRETRIRMPDGKVKPFHGRCPFGSETYDLLERILLANSDFIPLVSENWQYALVSRMRAIFHDPPGQDHFFETQRYPTYGIRIQPQRKWRIITFQARG